MRLPLEGSAGIAVIVADANSPEESPAMLDSQPCDIPITDFYMPNRWPEHARPDPAPPARPFQAQDRSAETVCFRLVCVGHSPQLNRSVKTISSQKIHAMGKLGLKSDLDVFFVCP